MLISVVQPNFILVNYLLPMGHFTPTELISVFSSCPKLAQVSHSCGISQPQATKIQQNTKSLLHTRMPETQGGRGAGKKRHHMKKTVAMKSASN